MAELAAKLEEHEALIQAWRRLTELEDDFFRGLPEETAAAFRAREKIGEEINESAKHIGHWLKEHA